MAKQILIDDSGATFTHTEPPSVRWMPLKRMNASEYGVPKHWEVWENNLYYCNVERFRSGFPIGGGEYARIGISAIGDYARHDWREFQWIKNDICDGEWEAVEIYPAERRLLDPSNHYYLWCVPHGVLQIGLFNGRRVYNPKEACAPQRPFWAGKKDY